MKIPQGSAAATPDAVKFPPSSVARRVLRVLLAEDTPTNQKLAEYLLTKRGHIVEIAQDGQQALELIEQHDYDVVLMDVQMPIMDGFQATAAIRSLADPVKAGLPIIALTAHALKEDAKRCLAAGMDAYVSKPIQADEFIELVELLGESEADEADQFLSRRPMREIPSSSEHPEQNMAEAQVAAAENVPAFDLKEAVNKCFGKYEFFLDMVGRLFR